MNAILRSTFDRDLEENDHHAFIESDGEISMDSGLFHDSSSEKDPDSSLSSGSSESSVSGSNQSDF